MTKDEMIKLIKDYISAHGATEETKRLLYGLQHENALHVEFIPDETFHDLITTTVSSIPPEMVSKLQRAYPESDWPLLAAKGRSALGEIEVSA